MTLADHKLVILGDAEGWWWEGGEGKSKGSSFIHFGYFHIFCLLSYSI